MPKSRIRSWERYLRKKIWVLMDPDKYNPGLAERVADYGVGLILAGGSRMKKNSSLSGMIDDIRLRTRLPVVIFPSGSKDLCPADGILFTSLLTADHPRFIIREQARAVQKIKKLGLKHISVAYFLVGSASSEVQRASGSRPIPFEKDSEIISMALAAEWMGFKAVYLEAGSGSSDPVPPRLIKKIKKNISVPLIVGGGIHKTTQIQSLFQSGADVVVIGNALEKNPEWIKEFKFINS